MSRLEENGIAVESVTKANIFEALKKLNEALVFGDEDSQELFGDFVDSFKPQKGGGQSANPPKEIDGVMHYHCRFFKDYLPETEMVFSQGKCKGTSKLGQKLSYDLKKKSDELLLASVKDFTSGRIEEGTAKVNEANEIKASIEVPLTYVEERERLALEASMEQEVEEDIV